MTNPVAETNVVHALFSVSPKGIEVRRGIWDRQSTLDPVFTSRK